MAVFHRKDAKKLLNLQLVIIFSNFRWLNWMHNKNIKDEMKRTLEHKVCIGEFNVLSSNNTLIHLLVGICHTDQSFSIELNLLCDFSNLVISKINFGNFDKLL